ncbi:DNA-binding response regulator [Lysobacter pythonis]|uniref:DNA-binding response regulator n=1 Tax=Solilutibacter pythonis TaxID=2483112 RepID=A0A3M2HSD6_9GAMM|nr:LytTR family DNA-binding domain-containing protein [Lysobacter pythonis]RMH89087.1 DNA-binding response regulator [Lysobacter pythonis]
MKILIVDDEPLARARLRGLLSREADTEILAEAGDGHAALLACDRHRPDLVMLDIRMPGMDGLQVARALVGQPAPPLIVFCTAYDEHALAAFDSAALDYLVKPVRAERLAETLRRARARLGEAPPMQGPQSRTQLCARLGGQLRLIPVADIRYLQAEEKYVVIHHAHGEDLIEESLKSLEEEFGERFLRIHRNCLIARDALKALQRDGEGHAQVWLHGVDHPLDVSRRSLAEIKEAMREWV